MSMIKSIIGSKAYIKPQGFLDSNSVSSLITYKDKEEFLENNINYVSIDFSKVISMTSKALKNLNEQFEALHSNIEVSIFNANNLVYQIIRRLDNRFFNFYESEEVEKLFTENITINKNIYVCCIKKETNKHQILHRLIKKGYNPIVVNSEEEIKDKKESIIIKNSLIYKFANRFGGVEKDGIIYFHMDGFLDFSLVDKFDMEYFKRSLSLGYRVFVFDMSDVKGLNAKAVSFFLKLEDEALKYEALMAIVNLDSKNVQEKLLVDLESKGFVFFSNEEEFLRSDVLRELKSAKRKQKKITKELANILPFFVNSTIETIELMTGIKSKKEKPIIKNISFDIQNFVASSLSFYGDIDGMVVLIFSENLTKHIANILLGKAPNTKEELNDIVSEFTNIIVGNTKSEFEKHNVDIYLNLPEVFDDIEGLKLLVKERKAIEVKFYFNNEKFYFYLTS